MRRPEQASTMPNCASPMRIVLASAIAGCPSITSVAVLMRIAKSCRGWRNMCSKRKGMGIMNNRKATEGRAHHRTRQPATATTTPATHKTMDQPSTAPERNTNRRNEPPASPTRWPSRCRGRAAPHPWGSNRAAPTETTERSAPQSNRASSPARTPTRTPAGPAWASRPTPYWPTKWPPRPRANE